MRVLPAVFLAACLIFPACASRTPDRCSIPDMAHNSRNSLEWAGAYSGILPCDLCESMQAEVRLGYDNTYILKAECAGKEDGSIVEEGGFEWESSGNRIRFKGEGGSCAPGWYKVGENVLIYYKEINTEGENGREYRLSRKSYEY